MYHAGYGRNAAGEPSKGSIQLYLPHHVLPQPQPPLLHPPEIYRLRNLIHLDLSGNQLTTLTPSLGMLTSLPFDNRLTTHPLKLGNLHQLQMLGIEDSPLDSKMHSITQKDGTVALIAYLRDSFPPPPEPPGETMAAGHFRRRTKNPTIRTECLSLQRPLQQYSLREVSDFDNIRLYADVGTRLVILEGKNPQLDCRTRLRHCLP